LRGSRKEDEFLRELGLGIDTGGTYTDAAVVDLATRKVLAKAKAPTTHDDLSVGILGAVDAILASFSFDMSELSHVGISTTLATNSILEGRGSDVGLIGIGWTPKAKWELGAKRTAFINGSFDPRGREVDPLEEEQVESAVEEVSEEVDALVISGIFSVVNSCHEEKLRELVSKKTRLPVVLGHELTAELGILERSVTAVLNAKLLPVMEAFMDGVVEALHARSITAPIMVYKGDGSLMSVERAKARPVETILSGPAASLIGGRVLSGLDTCIVIDIGGTSTDIAFLDEGFPRLSRSGAIVGRWRTRVRATDIWTAALGGDSRISMVDGRITFGPERVVPLGVAADAHRRLLHKMQKYRRFEFLIAYNRDDSRLEKEERAVLKLLREKGPMSPEEIVQALPDVYLPRSFASDLRSRGQVISTGLTPTDLLNAVGDYSRGSRYASDLGVEVFTSTYGLDKDEFVRSTLELVSSRMAEELLYKIIEDGSGGLLQGKGGEYLLDLITREAKGPLEMTIRLDRPIVGIGAPAHFFVPRLERLLNTKVVVPENHHVGNAVGAVCSMVFDSVTIQVHSRDNRFHFVAPFCEPQEFDRLEAAVEAAKAMALEHVQQQVRLAGGSGITTKVEVRGPGSGSGRFRLGWTQVTARASGKPGKPI